MSWGGRLLNYHIVAMESSNHHTLETLTSTDKLLGHICLVRKVFKILKSQVTIIFPVMWPEQKKGLKHKQHKVLVIENNADI